LVAYDEAIMCASDDTSAAQAVPAGHSEAGWRKAARGIVRLPGEAMILGVRGYQLFIGPLLGKHCRFYPSCSNYFVQAVRKHGAIVGAWKGVCRIGRCHPWHPGGYDPP
jgi:putative membrane protein insertion efficiency factor